MTGITDESLYRRENLSQQIQRALLGSWSSATALSSSSSFLINLVLKRLCISVQECNAKASG
jgi:hypothetical protein